MEHNNNNNNNNNNDQSNNIKGKTKLCDLNLSQIIDYLNSKSNHKFNQLNYEEWLYCMKKYLNSFPPGYQFDPSNKELIIDYLLPKINGRNLPLNLMHEVNIYKFNPDELTGMYSPQGSKAGCWYFFTPRDKKYKNGKRPNRKAGDGYWKATGADKCIRHNNIDVGFRKALVYYQGKPPQGKKTTWIMHEFREAGPSQVQNRRFSTTLSEDTSMRLDDYVLCRIYKKNPSNKNKAEQEEELNDENVGEEHEQELSKETETSPNNSNDKIPPPIIDNNIINTVLVNDNNNVNMYYPSNNSDDYNVIYNGLDNINPYHTINNGQNVSNMCSTSYDNQSMIGTSSIDGLLNTQSMTYDDYSACYDGSLQNEMCQNEGEMYQNEMCQNEGEMYQNEMCQNEGEMYQNEDGNIFYDPEFSNEVMYKYLFDTPSGSPSSFDSLMGCVKDVLPCPPPCPPPSPTPPPTTSMVDTLVEI